MAKVSSIFTSKILTRQSSRHTFGKSPAMGLLYDAPESDADGGLLPGGLAPASGAECADSTYCQKR